MTLLPNFKKAVVYFSPNDIDDGLSDPGHPGASVSRHSPSDSGHTSTRSRGSQPPFELAPRTSNLIRPFRAGAVDRALCHLWKRGHAVSRVVARDVGPA